MVVDLANRPLLSAVWCVQSIMEPKMNLCIYLDADAAKFGWLQPRSGTIAAAQRLVQYFQWHLYQAPNRPQLLAFKNLCNKVSCQDFVCACQALFEGQVGPWKALPWASIISGTLGQGQDSGMWAARAEQRPLANKSATLDRRTEVTNLIYIFNLFFCAPVKWISNEFTTSQEFQIKNNNTKWLRPEPRSRTETQAQPVRN